LPTPEPFFHSFHTCSLPTEVRYVCRQAALQGYHNPFAHLKCKRADASNDPALIACSGVAGSFSGRSKAGSRQRSHARHNVWVDRPKAQPFSHHHFAFHLSNVIEGGPPFVKFPTNWQVGGTSRGSCRTSLLMCVSEVSRVQKARPVYYYSYYNTLFLPRGKVRLQTSCSEGCRFLPLVGLARSKSCSLL
jgi:hypothetical protein